MTDQFHRIRRKRLLKLIKVSTWMVRPLGKDRSRRWFNWITPRLCPSEDRIDGHWQRAEVQPHIYGDGRRSWWDEWA